jgi:hypothetical protein
LGPSNRIFRPSYARSSGESKSINSNMSQYRMIKFRSRLDNLIPENDGQYRTLISCVNSSGSDTIEKQYSTTSLGVSILHNLCKLLQRLIFIPHAAVMHRTRIKLGQLSMFTDDAFEIDRWLLFQPDLYSLAFRYYIFEYAASSTCEYVALRRMKSYPHLINVVSLYTGNHLGSCVIGT